MKWFYEVVYQYFRAPWDIGEREELVNLVENGRIKPCRTIDLGSGTASNCIFLAQHGFDALLLGIRRGRLCGSFCVGDGSDAAVDVCVAWRYLGCRERWQQ